jgi:HEPN domain-containing protein
MTTEPTTTPQDPDHWLYRLTEEEWLAAARNELESCRAALRARNRRAGVVGARRATGMALNALLVRGPIERYEAFGRSYMDHLQALAQAAEAPLAIREAAQRLVDAPTGGAQVVTLRRSAEDAAESEVAHWAEQIIAHVQRQLAAPPAVA